MNRNPPNFDESYVYVIQYGFHENGPNIRQSWWSQSVQIRTDMLDKTVTVILRLRGWVVRPSSLFSLRKITVISKSLISSVVSGKMNSLFVVLGGDSGSPDVMVLYLLFCSCGEMNEWTRIANQTRQKMRTVCTSTACAIGS